MNFLKEWIEGGANKEAERPAERLLQSSRCDMMAAGTQQEGRKELDGCKMLRRKEYSTWGRTAYGEFSRRRPQKGPVGFWLGDLTARGASHWRNAQWERDGHPDPRGMATLGPKCQGHCECQVEIGSWINETEAQKEIWTWGINF